MRATTTMTRRDFNRAAATAVAAGFLPAGCTRDRPGPTYETLVAATWRHTPRRPDRREELLRELVRYATLAANSHNTQPWRYRLGADRIVIMPDFARRCPAVDPDDHHLFASLGCAAENLQLAARALGLRAQITLNEAPDERTPQAVVIDLEQDIPRDSPLFQAIPKRQCTRAAYDGRPVPADQLATLEAVATGEGVSVRLLTEKRDMASVLDYVIAGNTAQMQDEAFVRELRDWIRFNKTAAVRWRDGLFTGSSGNPTMPDWLGNLVFDFAFNAEGENDKYRRHIRSSAGAVVFVADRNHPRAWIEVGRCYQRFALQATAFGLRHAFVNQAVEVPVVRVQFADYLGIGDRRPNLVVRFGYGPELPRSLRRPLDQVIV